MRAGILPGLLSLVILGHNRASISALCLRSLLRVAFRPLEIIFVNNGSTDRTRAILQLFADHAAGTGIDFQVIHLERNGGSIGPRNLALSRCRGEWIALVDNDVIVRSVRVFERLVGV